MKRNTENITRIIILYSDISINKSVELTFQFGTTGGNFGVLPK